MDMNLIAELLQVAMPSGLIVVLIWWVLGQGWPYWKDRDSANREREHEREMAQIEAQKDTANATARFAEALDAFTQILREVCEKGAV